VSRKIARCSKCGKVLSGAIREALKKLAKQKLEEEEESDFEHLCDDCKE